MKRRQCWQSYLSRLRICHEITCLFITYKAASVVGWVKRAPASLSPTIVLDMTFHAFCSRWWAAQAALKLATLPTLRLLPIAAKALQLTVESQATSVTGTSVFTNGWLKRLQSVRQCGHEQQAMDRQLGLFCVAKINEDDCLHPTLLVI